MINDKKKLEIQMILWNALKAHASMKVESLSNLKYMGKEEIGKEKIKKDLDKIKEICNLIHATYNDMEDIRNLDEELLKYREVEEFVDLCAVSKEDLFTERMDALENYYDSYVF